ncbi:hypothetical protein BH09MYX1_BH09MYX1_07690 [soil metagenome]
MHSARVALTATIACVALATSCTDVAPDGLYATPAGNGPEVVFDVARRPLPEIPVPNDVATFPDPTSRTGRRINVSLVAPTDLERSAREGFSEMEGWGTYAPLSVAFARGKDAPANEAAIDLERVRQAMQGDQWNTSDDPGYVINLTTGVPVLLDMGSGNFPQTIRDRDRYYANDPRAAESNTLFETVEEGAGLSQAQYRADLDTDFDGVLDHPNTLPKASGDARIAGIDDLMNWYERQTDTLILRPVLPMDEKTEYAVVLTDRLTDARGRPVRSPFPFVHHPQQRDAIARVQRILGDGARAGYYGSIAGTGLTHVAFAWSFTTEPAAEDLRLLRNGLHGTGPFAHLSTEFPPTATAFRAAGLIADPSADTAAWKTDPKCTAVSQAPFVVKIDQVKATLADLITRVFPLSAAEGRALLDSLDSVDHFVLGSYPVAYFLGADPEHENPFEHFHLNYQTGEGRVVHDVGHFWLSVPKAKGTFKQPFDTVVWGHGTTLNAAETIIRAGYFAKQGLATFGFDGPGHGLVFDQGLKVLAQGLLYNACLVPWVQGLTAGRARDIDGDGAPDSGGLLWTAHIFHSRDNIRQTVTDGLQASRVIRAFDGRIGPQDFNDDGKPELNGDFDADGIPDVGGKDARLFSSGDSYGGIFAQIHAAIDPNITAGVAISGGGGLTDVATRSYGVVDSVVEQTITPLVVGVPANTRSTDKKPGSTLCTADQRSVRIVVNDLTDSREIEVACLRATELDTANTVVVRNLETGEVRCGGTTTDGRFRVPIPATAGDRVRIEVSRQANAVESYGTCVWKDGVNPERIVDTFEQPAAAYRPVGDASAACASAAGCQQYRNLFFPVGDALVAPQTGLALRRQSPELRRLIQLSQAALETGDPINFAPLYMMRPNPLPSGQLAGPKGFLGANTVADGFVVVATGHAFARAMGALPFLPPTALKSMPDYADYATPPSLFAAFGGKTPNQLLIDNFAIEAVARLRRVPADASCAPNARITAECPTKPAVNPDVCAQTVYDPDWHSEGKNLFGAQHPIAPLRLARRATVHVKSAEDLEATWEPRLKGAPFGIDETYVPLDPLVGLVDAYVAPLGEHVWINENPCKNWDEAVYYDGMTGRFFATGGTDVYFLSHPATHQCMADQSCDFLK